MHLLDKLENDNMPDATVSTNTMLFSDVRAVYADAILHAGNTGQVRDDCCVVGAILPDVVIRPSVS